LYGQFLTNQGAIEFFNSTYLAVFFYNLLDFILEPTLLSLGVIIGIVLVYNEFVHRKSKGIFKLATTKSYNKYYILYFGLLAISSVLVLNQLSAQSYAMWPYTMYYITLVLLPYVFGSLVDIDRNTFMLKNFKSSLADNTSYSDIAEKYDELDNATARNYVSEDTELLTKPYYTMFWRVSMTLLLIFIVLIQFNVGMTYNQRYSILIPLFQDIYFSQFYVGVIYMIPTLVVFTYLLYRKIKYNSISN
jgi:hypothetical protein